MSASTVAGSWVARQVRVARRTGWAWPLWSQFCAERGVSVVVIAW